MPKWISALLILAVFQIPVRALPDVAPMQSDFDANELTKLWNMAVKAPCKIAEINQLWPAELQSFIASSFEWKQYINQTTSRTTGASSLTDPGIEPDYPNRKVPPYVLQPAYSGNPCQTGLTKALINDKYNRPAMKLLAEFEQQKAQYEWDKIDAEIAYLESTKPKLDNAKEKELKAPSTQAPGKLTRLQELRQRRANLPVGILLTNYVRVYKDLKREYQNLRKYEKGLSTESQLDIATQESSNIHGANSKPSIEKMYVAAFNRTRVRFEDYVGNEAADEFLKDLSKSQIP